MVHRNLLRFTGSDRGNIATFTLYFSCEGFARIYQEEIHPISLSFEATHAPRPATAHLSWLEVLATTRSERTDAELRVGSEPLLVRAREPQSPLVRISRKVRS